MTTSWLHTAYAQQVRFGEGASARLRPLLKDAGTRRALVLTSPSVGAAAVIDGLGRAVVARFEEHARHVPVPVVRAAAQLARSEAVDTLVSIGGGSVIDLAKAVAFFLEQEAGTPGASFADRPNFVHIAVPTTLAGAEGTSRFSMTDPAARHKQGTESPTLVPRWTVYDPVLLAATPPSVFAASAMTALGHAIGALVAPASPEAEVLGAAALGRLYGGLSAAAGATAGRSGAAAGLLPGGSPSGEAGTSGPAGLSGPSGPLGAAAGDAGGGAVEPAVMAAAFEGAALAARSAQNSAPSLVGALAQLLGGRCGVGHGEAVALVLPQVLRFNADAIGARMEQLGAVIGTADIATAIEELRGELGLPGGLSALGVGDDDVAAVARLAQQHPAWRTNPRPVGEGDIVALLEAAH